MLLRFRVGNHKSLRSEQEFNLIATTSKDHAENLAHPDGIGEAVVRTAAVYGANASGKSNLVDAIFYMARAVCQSQRYWAPQSRIVTFPFLLDQDSDQRPFLLDHGSEQRPSLYEVDLLLGGVRYQYGFTLHSQRVLEEWLYSYAHGRRSTLFTRSSASDRPIKPGRTFTGTRAIEALTRDNSLFLSAAAQSNYSKILPIYDWFSSARFVFPQDLHGAERHLQTQSMLSEHASEIIDLLRIADLGIVGLSLIKREPPDSSYYPGASRFEFASDLRQSKVWGDGFGSLPDEIMLHHRTVEGDGLALPWETESHGTQAWFRLTGPIVNALLNGTTLVVDELDASLHPMLSLEITRLFNDSSLNPKNAQLLFTTHDTNLLGADVLRRDQVWFTEKDEAGATHLYSLADFMPRKNANQERGYLQGRFGAIPFVGATDFLQTLGAEDA